MKLINKPGHWSELKINDKSFFFSYETLVAIFDEVNWWKTSEKYSRTTTRAMNTYLPEIPQEQILTEEQLQSKVYAELAEI